MKASENLFDLIKSLNKAEFENILSLSQLHIKGEENKYLVLLQLINQQQVYDERIIIEKLGYTKALNKFAFLKNYTYNFILKSLEDQSSLPLKLIRNKISQGELMLLKQNYELAAILFDQAIELSAKYQAYSMWVEALNIRNSIDIPQPERNKVFSIKRILEANETFFNYRKLFMMVRLKHHQTSFIRNIEEKKEFKNVYDEELMESNPNLNFGHKMYFYLSKGIVYYAKKEFDKAYIMVKELDKLWNNFPWMIESRAGAFYNTYYNKALIELNFKQYQQAIQSIKELKSKLDKTKRENPFQRFMLYNLLVDIYRRCGYFDEALKIIDEYAEVRKMLYKPDSNLYSQQLYHFYLANIYFGVEDFKSANKHINEIINNDISYNNDVTCISHMMSLLIHFELEKSDLLTSRIKSVYRTLKKRDCMVNIIDHVLSFLKNYAKNPSDIIKIKEGLVELKKKVDMEIESDPVQRELLDYFDLSAWLTSKIEKKPFIEVLKINSGNALG